MPRVPSSKSLLILVGSMLASACVPDEPRGVVEAPPPDATNAVGGPAGYSPIPPGLATLKADLAAKRKAQAEERKAAMKAQEEVEEPYDPARAPTVTASFADPAFTTIALTIARPRFFNLNPAIVVEQAGTFSPRSLASNLARFLASHMAVCSNGDCAKVESVAARDVVYTSSGKPADSIGDDAFVVSGELSHTRPVDGRCVLSASGSQTGRVTYLSPRLRFEFEVVVSEAEAGSTVELSFPGLTDGFGGAPVGVAVVDEAERGEVTCRGAWSGSGRPPELEHLVTAKIADPGTVTNEEATAAEATEESATETEESATETEESATETEDEAAATEPEPKPAPTATVADDEAAEPPAESAAEAPAPAAAEASAATASPPEPAETSTAETGAEDAAATSTTAE